MEKCHEVVAKPAHFAFSVEQRVFKDSSPGAVVVPLLVDSFLDAGLLSGRLGIGPLSDGLLKEHHDERADLLGVRLRVLRALSEQNWHLVAF